jgi:exonuclease III
MRIVSWNCHYGLDDLKAKTLLDTFPDADILVVQECKRTDMDAFKRAWKFKNWYGDDQEYSDLGIAVFSKELKINFASVFNRNYRYVMPYTVVSGERLLTLFAVWTKPVPFYYDENITKAVCSSEYQNLVNGDVVIIGDFNTGYVEEHKERYNDLVNGLKGFKDCADDNPEKSKKTFYYDRKRKLYLNDFCFVSESLHNNVKFSVHDEWEINDNNQHRWNGSDHCPIIVDFDF